MTRLCCPNCGIQIDPQPQSLGELPLEDIVTEDNRIRTLQYQASRSGIEYHHSVNIASNFPIGYGGSDGH